MLNDDFDPFCKIFLDTDFDRTAVLASVRENIGGVLEQSSITNDICNLDLLRNDDFHEHKRNESPDGFLFSRYLIEIEPNEDVGTETYIATLSRLLEGLWRMGYKAVASCDFEELLPNMGGYNPDNR
ncbi:1,4-dihydroxy-6-naphthoate synthase [Paenibacillus sp. sgz5001063]|uniref:1,4-dihydroxy-6-naphthoate synthase n=1 Tax=Paenibacillus sp. sgz5001063 TaxID=3242474 RepID=UPI0036D2F301